MANLRQPELLVNGLRDVVAKYEGFILDLWGVVHDGVHPFPDTIPTLTELKKAKRKIWLLSNAPRRSDTVVARLTEMGIDRSLYDGIMTSGEATYLSIRDRYLGEWGRKCFHIGPPRDSSLYEGLDIHMVGSPEEADFVLNSGIHDFGDTVEKYKPVLHACADRNLPMICANPDRIVHVGHELVYCAGSLADAYEKMDGQVTYFGKPYHMVYRHCIEGLGTENILAIGDAMVTDVAGATGVGIDSALVYSGIHRGEVMESCGQNHKAGFFEAYPYRPTYLLDRFFW